MSDEPRAPLRKVGGLWRPRPGTKSLGSGSITVGRFKQRFIVVANDKKEPGSSQPDYLLLTSSDPEADAYTTRTAPADPTVADEVPF